MTNLYDHVVEVISKPPPERAVADLEPLIPWFRNKAELFGQVDGDVVLDIIRECEFITRCRDEVIIRQGDIGDCFYVLLRGGASVFINNAMSDGDELSAGESLDHHTPGDSQDSQIPGESLDPGNECDPSQTERMGLRAGTTGTPDIDKPVLLASGADREKYGCLVLTYDVGSSFGELALLSRECVRNATIIAEETSDLLAVPRQLYNRSLRAWQKVEFEERSRFVQECSLFRAWQPRYKRQMAMSITRMATQFEQTIIKQGEPVTHLYFITKGQAKLVVDPEQHLVQYPDLHPGLGWSPSHLTSSLHLLSPRIDAVVPPPEKLCLSPSAKRRRPTARRLHEMSIVGECDVIGDTELALDLKTYAQSVVSTEPCRLFRLDMRNYERLVLRRNPSSLLQLRAQAEIKLHGRLQRLGNQKIPIFRSFLAKVQFLLGKYSPRRSQDPPSGKLTNQTKSPRDADTVTPFEDATVRGGVRLKVHHARSSKLVSGLSTMTPVTSTSVDPDSSGALEAALQDIPEFYMEEYQPPADHHDTIPVPYHPSSLSLEAPTREISSFLLTSLRQSSTMSAIDDVTNKSHRPNRVDSFNDFASSERVLSELESRLEAWNATSGVHVTHRGADDRPYRMKRVTLEKPVKPGVTVVLRRKDTPDPPTISFISRSGLSQEGKDTTPEHEHQGVGKVHKSTGSDAQLLGNSTKRRPPHQHTAEDYAILKRLLVWRERTAHTFLGTT